MGNPLKGWDGGPLWADRIKVNTDNFDGSLSSADDTVQKALETLDDIDFDATYLRLDTTNDPLTGELVITPSSGTTALFANQDIKLLAGKKLILDGA